LLKFWGAVRQWGQQDGLDDAENRGGGANAQGKRQHRGERKSRTLPETAERGRQILAKDVDHVTIFQCWGAPCKETGHRRARPVFPSASECTPHVARCPARRKASSTTPNPGLSEAEASTASRSQSFELSDLEMGPEICELEPDYEVAQTGEGDSRRCLIAVDQSNRL
jgi:hypothetical protein